MLNTLRLTRSRKLRRILETEKDRPFLVSFSEKEDDLSMWRGYGGIVRGEQGISIGFDLKALEQIAEENLANRPLNVTYKRSDALKYLSLESERARQTISVTRLSLEDLADIVLDLAPYYKHEKFEEEREWRITKIVAGPDVAPGEFVVAGDALRYPIYLDQAKLPCRLGISKVILGPTTKKRPFQAFLDAAGFEDLQVVESEVPYI